jgi:hypothetical protein
MKDTAQIIFAIVLAGILIAGAIVLTVPHWSFNEVLTMHDWIALFLSFVVMASLITIVYMINRWVSVQRIIAYDLMEQQIRTTNKALCVDTQLRLEQTFDGLEMAKWRMQLAESLLQNYSPESAPENVLNFFESMGNLLYGNYIDAELVWGFFSFYVVSWWYASQLYIANVRVRQGNDTLFAGFEYLKEEMLRITQEKRTGPGVMGLISSEADILQFLRDERARGGVMENIG